MISGSQQMYSDADKVREARANYFLSNGIPLDGGIHDKWARYKMGPFTLIGFPNFQQRMEAILCHDLHHIILNLDASSLGEGLIAAWELGSGCGRYWISWCMEPQALWWGILMAPRKTFSFFILGRGSRNFFHKAVPANFLNLPVGDLRKELLPENQNSLRTNFGDVLLFAAMAILGIFMIFIFIPIFFFFTVFGGLWEAVKRGRLNDKRLRIYNPMLELIVAIKQHCQSGHEVHLIDPVELHVNQALEKNETAQRKLKSAAVGASQQFVIAGYK
jgi:hypothetical protein